MGSIDPNKFRTKLVKVKLADLKVSTFQPEFRVTEKRIKELAASILEMGGLVNPIKVDQALNVIDGHTRVSALMLLGYTEWYVEQFPLVDKGRLFNLLNSSQAISKTQWLSSYLKGGEVPKSVQKGVEDLADILNEDPNSDEVIEILQAIVMRKYAVTTVVMRYRDIVKRVGRKTFKPKKVITWLLREQNAKIAKNGWENHNMPFDALSHFIKNDFNAFIPENDNWEAIYEV